MTKDVKVTLSFNEDVASDEIGDFVSDEFLEYKKLTFTQSDNNFITPNENFQKNNQSLHSLFGRDRVFDYPRELLTDIHYDNLTHVHVDKDNEWSDNTNQWYCCSKFSIVYSGFKVNEKHIHLIVHDLLLNIQNDPDFDAHNHYTQDDVEYYLDSAAYYRKIFKPK